MKQEIKVNDKVEIYPHGTTFIVKDIQGKFAILETEAGEIVPATPLSILDKVEVIYEKDQV